MRRRLSKKYDLISWCMNSRTYIYHKCGVVLDVMKRSMPLLEKDLAEV